MSPRKRPQADPTLTPDDQAQETLLAMESALRQKIQEAPDGSDEKSRLQDLLCLQSDRKTQQSPPTPQKRRACRLPRSSRIRAVSSMIEANEEIERHPVPFLCPACGRPLQNKGMKSKTLLASFGTVTLHRRYGFCRSCRKGGFPDDARLGLDGTGLSPEGPSLSGLFGAETDFTECLFPGALCIVDRSHAKTHLSGLSKALFGATPKAKK